MEATIQLNINDVKSHLVTNKFIFPTAQTYQSIESSSKGFHTYGPVGLILKNKIIQLWRDIFLTQEIYEIDTPLLQSKEVLTNSGHVGKFTDLVISNGKEIFRADHLVKDHCEKNNIQLLKPIDDFNKEELLSFVKEYKIVENYQNATIEPKNLMFNFGDLYLRPEIAQGMFTEFENFYGKISQLPFGLAQVGKSYRNEISPQPFVRLKEFTQAEIEYFFDPNFTNHPLYHLIKNLDVPLLTNQMQLTNSNLEIFNINDMVESGVIVNQIMAYFIGTTYKFITKLGLTDDCIRFRQHLPNELAHYAIQCWDLEIKLANGSWLECIGLAHRGDYDLKNHNIKNQNTIKEYSSKVKKYKIQIKPNQSKENIKNFNINFNTKIFNSSEEILNHPYYHIVSNMTEIVEIYEHVDSVVIPNVIEPSIGIDRIFFGMANNLLKRRTGDQNKILFNLPLKIAPYQLAIFCLSNDENLVKFTQSKFVHIANIFLVYWDFSSVSIGKKYVRSDSIGIGLAITVDFQTLNKNDKNSYETVTLRYSANGEQIRIPISEIINIVKYFSSV